MKVIIVLFVVIWGMWFGNVIVMRIGVVDREMVDDYFGGMWNS